MKEKYIFFILLAIAAIMVDSGAISKQSKGEISMGEQALEEKLELAAQKKVVLPEKVELNQVKNLEPSSYYEGLLRRSPFFRFAPKQAATKRPKPKRTEPMGEEITPVFAYKGRISAGSRVVVIIEEVNSGETFMVAKNESVGGYKVLDITDTEVILSKKGEENIVLKTVERP